MRIDLIIQNDKQAIFETVLTAGVTREPPAVDENRIYVTGVMGPVMIAKQ